MPVDGSDDESGGGSRQDDESSSSSDENDSAAAAHAAAIGHSPQPLPIKVVVPPIGAEEKEVDGVITAEAASKDGNDTMDEGNTEQTNGESAPMAISPNECDRQDVPPNGETNGLANQGETPQKKPLSKPKKKKKFYCPHNLNERDTDDNTALHIAIHERKLEHVKLLLQAGASIHKKSDGSAPIHTAISMGSVAKHAEFAYDCVVALNEKGADLTAKDESLHTPLYLACTYNLSQIANYILTTEAGKTTLNARADRSQGRPLHAAAKFDSVCIKPTQASTAVAPGQKIVQHNPDGTVSNALHYIPGFPGKTAAGQSEAEPLQPPQSQVTQILLNSPGIEVNAANSVGQTPLHIACSKGNWPVVRLLLRAGASPETPDRRGFTPGQLSHKRGMPIPNDLLAVLGGPPLSGTVAPPRDLVVDPDSKTLVLTHELCGLHHTCSPIRRDPNSEPPPENVRRLHVLTDEETGILRGGEFSKCAWENETRRAALVDVLKVWHSKMRS